MSIERITRLEERSLNHGALLKEVHTSFRILTDEVKLIRVKLEKSLSFAGGFAFAFGMMGSAVVILMLIALKKITGIDLLT